MYRLATQSMQTTVDLNLKRAKCHKMLCKLQPSSVIKYPLTMVEALFLERAGPNLLLIFLLVSLSRITDVDGSLLMLCNLFCSRVATYLLTTAPVACSKLCTSGQLNHLPRA